MKVMDNWKYGGREASISNNIKKMKYLRNMPMLKRKHSWKTEVDLNKWVDFPYFMFMSRITTLQRFHLFPT